jgi:site-specific recombinase XerD
VVFDQLLQSWLDSHGSLNTRSAYGSDLALFGRWCAGQNAIPLRVTAEDVAAYQAACDASGDSPSTIRRRSSALSSFFQFAIAHDAIVDNPVAGSERPQVASGDPSPTPALDADVMRQYLHDASQLDCRLHALVALLALDGVKLSEALSLDVTDIAASSRRVSAHVIRSGARVPLVLHPEAGGAVRRCADGRTAGPLLVSEQRSAAGGEPRRLTRFGADHLIKRLARHSGTPLTANALRRFYVSSTHAAGVDIDHIRERAGLSDVRSARRYLPTNTHHAADHGSGRRHNTKEV